MNQLAKRQAGRLGRLCLALLQVFALIGSSLAVPSARAAGTIIGVVYHDHNGNGRRDTAATLPNNGAGVIGTAIDNGIAGVLVTAFDAAGVQRGSATTTATGSYTLNVTGTGPYRIEFTNFPTGYEPGAQGTDNASTVRFVPDGNSSNIDLGLVLPTAYCQDNPQLVTSCFFQGDLVSGPNSTQAALVSFPYSAGSNGAVIAAYDNPTTRSVSIPAASIGATWGLAFARSTQRLYAAALFKKHASFGPGGPGAIYVINPATSAVIATFTVPGATRNSHNTSDYLVDNGNTAWDAVGKDALGGLDLSDDESRLFVMNLENRTLYALDPISGAVLASQPVPLNPPLPGGASCPASDVRPFAVEFHNGQVYVGMICSAESSANPANLRAYVYTADPLTLTFSPAPAFDFALNYPRGRANDGGGGATPSAQPAAWNPWVPTFTAFPPNIGDQNYTFPVYPQPMFTGLTFDANGDMVFGLRDRFGDQTGNQSPSNPADFTQLYFGVTAGDTLRACALPGGGWSLESNGLCGSRGTPGNPNNSAGQGPGGGEFYFADDFSNPNNSGDYHDELSLGAVLQVPGFPDVVATMFDPISRQVGPNEIADFGARWFNNASGNASKAFRLINGDFADGRTFAKANGLGDLVALCNAAPIEIGNRVWEDTNRNGVQDPGEIALPGITVQLFDPTTNTVIATAVTDANGNYYFGSDPGRPSTSSAVYNLPIQFNRNYQVRIDLTQTAIATPRYTLTTPDANSGSGSDLRDSDGQPVGNFAIASFSTGTAGQNNHTYDFGFYVTPTAVRLLYFRVEAVTGAAATLAWETGAEWDNVGFRLYRNATAERSTASEVAFIPAAANRASGARYLYTDVAPAPGLWWYWLVDIDTNGTETVHGPVSSGLDLSVLPNKIFLPLVRR